MRRREFLALTTTGALASSAWGLTDTALATRPPLLMRVIPRTNERVPAIGLGTWQTFDVGRDAADRAQRLNVLKAFFGMGGTIIDSSPMYGRSESVVGDLWPKVPGAKPFMATKVWTRGKAAGIREMDRSMTRMGVKRMDLMQVHNLVDTQTHLATLRAWKLAGKVRYIGITHYLTSAFDDLEKLIRSEKLDFVQLPYSIVTRDAEKRLLPAAKDTGTAVLVNRPYEGGSLFRKVRGKPVPEWARELQATSWAQLFLKFILAHPAVTAPIPGTRKPKHLIDNMGAGVGPLPTADHLKRLTKALQT